MRFESTSMFSPMILLVFMAAFASLLTGCGKVPEDMNKEPVYLAPPSK